MGITDGNYVCSFCGESLTGCALCEEAPLVNVGDRFNLERTRFRDAETELWKQEQAIRHAADVRQGYRD